MAVEYFISVMKNPKIFQVCLIAIVAAAFLPGCEKNGSRSNPLAYSSIKKYSQAVVLSGSVSGQKGPVQIGKVIAAGDNGAYIASAELQSGGRYSIVIPQGTALPMVLKVYPETGQSSADPLEAVAVDPVVKKYEINPLSTAIAAKAKSLGGYTRENMVAAALASVTAPDANKTTGGFRGDPTKQYGGWH